MYAYIDMYVYAYMYIHIKIHPYIYYITALLKFRKCFFHNWPYMINSEQFISLFLCHTDLWQLPWELEVINIDKDYSMLLYMLVCHQKQWWSFYTSVKRWGCFGETYVHLCCLFRYLWLRLEIKIINYIYIYEQLYVISIFLLKYHQFPYLTIM